MNTCIIFGTINYFIEKEIKKITNGDPYVSYDLACQNFEELITEASFSSMFDDKKYIVVRNCDLLYASNKKKKAEQVDLFTEPTFEDEIENEKATSLKLFESYLKDENKNVYLIFICDKKPDLKKKVNKMINEAGRIITIENMTKTAMKDELLNILKKNNHTIDINDVWYIVNQSLNNFDIAYNELKKIMMYYNKPCHIESLVVKSLTCVNIRDNNFDLIDSILERNLDQSIKNMAIVKIYKVEPIVIFMGLISEIRKTIYISILKDKKYSLSEILSYVGIQQFQYSKYEKYLRIYNQSELKQLLLDLSDIDLQLKSETVDRELILYKFIFQNCE